MKVKFQILKNISILAPLSAFAVAESAHAESLSGPYVGADVGYENFEHLDINGITYGLFYGYNQPVSQNLIIGAEAMLADSSANSVRRSSNAAFVTEVRNSVGLSYGLSGRIGIRAGSRSLFYARTGWERIEVNSIRTRTPVPPTEDPAPVITDFGFRQDTLVLGAGMEHRVGKKMSVRLSYDYGEHFEQHSLRAGLVSAF